MVSAEADSLDTAVMSYMKEWFPKEVKAKQKENSAEIEQEQLQVQPKCIIM